MMDAVMKTMQPSQQGQSNALYLTQTEEGIPSSDRVNFYCHFCGLGLEYRWELQLHMKNKHNDLSVGTLRFTEHQKNFLTLSESHLNEGGDRKSLMKYHYCEFCPYKSYIKNDVIRHRRVHTGERPYKCKYCQYSATQRISIINHERIHTGEKPFQCDLCDYRAAHKRSLDIHFKKFHNSMN